MNQNKLLKKVLVIGQGYVGLPLALEITKARFQVTGLDINVGLISQLKKGVSPIAGVTDNHLKTALKSGLFNLSSDIDRPLDFDIAIICVPTPLNSSKKPDLSYLISASKLIGKNLKNGNLVIVESTVAPGTTRRVVLPILKEASSLSAEQFLLAYSPERIDPLNSEWHLTNTPKIVSGFDLRSQEAVLEFYSKFIENLVVAHSLESAEASKLLENAFRLVNIAFINEFWDFCVETGLDIQEVLGLSKTKPYGYMPFYPSLGAGGHCIPVDPVYLLDCAQSVGANIKILQAASEINSESPLKILKKVKKNFSSLLGKRILLIGVAYKKNISDTRDTPVKTLKDELERQGALVFWHDDLVANWEGENSVPITSGYDLAILCTPHDYLRMEALGATPLYDPRHSV